MKRKSTCVIFNVLMSCALASPWNNLSCPAPRAPDNGLSFIFRNGELIHFRCHPGYSMRGKAVTHCMNNHWTDPAPECVPIRKNHSNAEQQYYSRGRELFNWGEETPRNGVYGDGPRRLPLINGIWPPQKQQVLALGTPGPKTMIKEEIGIAELRHRQLEELKKQRFINGEIEGKKKRGKNSDDIETILALGSTEANKPPQKKKNGGKELVELRRRPVQNIRWSYYDASCIEYVFGRSLPKLAPQVNSAFVYRYETKKNKNYPFNEYMNVKYKCLTGYRFDNPLSQTLLCKDGKWIGDMPKCIARNT